VAAQAATITVPGAGFDIAFDDTTLSQLGAPALGGTTISFSPLQFAAESRDGNGEVINEQTAVLWVLPHPGQRVSAVDFREQGTYELSGRQSDVAAWGELRADFTAAGLPALSAAIAPDTPFMPNTGRVESWSALAGLDFGAAPDPRGSAGFVLTLNTLLQGYTRPSDTGLRVAAIQTVGPLTLQVAVVPEPPAVTLFAAGLAALAALVRRRSLG
jgi:hypothetical protein